MVSALRLDDGVSNWDCLFPGGIDQQGNLLVIQRNTALPCLSMKKSMVYGWINYGY